MKCLPKYAPAFRNARNLWSVGCSCGWLCDHPLRGDRERAQDLWRDHRAEVETASMGRLMTRRPVGPR